jgi:hypothetical protein
VRERRQRDQPGRDPGGQWGGRSFRGFFSHTAHTFTADLDPGLLGQHGGKGATMPLGMAGAMLQWVLIDEAMAVLFQCACHCGRSPGAGTIKKALEALVGKAMDPLAAGGRGQRKRVSNGVQALAFDNFTDRLGTPEDPGLFRLFPHRLQRWKRIIGQVELAGPHRRALLYKVLQKCTNMTPNIR